MKVSVITPSYQQGQFIERTLQSVADQRAPGIEIDHVVFDGGSSDNTVDVLKAFTPAVRWVSQKDNGQTDAVNQGIRATDGEIIGWLNSDDVYYPNAVKLVVEYFMSHPEIDVVYGMADHIDLDDHAFEPYPTESWNFDRMKETCIICQPALFFRRRVVEAHGLLDDSLSFCMDYEYWLRLGKAGVRFDFLEKRLAGSRLYADNKTLGARVKVHKEINDMFKRLFGEVPDRWLLNYAHAVLEGKSDRNNSPRSFIFKLIVLTGCAAWRWNGKISKGMKASLVQWGRETLFRG